MIYKITCQLISAQSTTQSSDLSKSTWPTHIQPPAWILTFMSTTFLKFLSHPCCSSCVPYLVKPYHQLVQWPVPPVAFLWLISKDNFLSKSEGEDASRLAVPKHIEIKKQGLWGEELVSSRGQDWQSCWAQSMWIHYFVIFWFWIPIVNLFIHSLNFKLLQFFPWKQERLQMLTESCVTDKPGFIHLILQSCTHWSVRHSLSTSHGPGMVQGAGI